MQIKTFKGGYDKNFTYVIEDAGQCLILDPAVPAETVLQYADQFKILAVVFLHSHFDHIVDLPIYREKGIAVWGHESTKIQVDRKLSDGEVIGIGNKKMQIIHTPGHRYDCICIRIEDNLFTSDTLFVEGCGRVDFPGSNPELMATTLEKIRNLPLDVKIFPGHDYGSTPTSTIAREKRNNKFLNVSSNDFLRRIG